MVIQHNLSALNAHRNLGINNSQTSKNLEKLSSGYRINRAADDAAGLAISEKMRGQIRGLNMAAQNTDNAISLIQTAEGGLNETHAILHRMRELAVQASNGTYQDDDRAQIALEVQALKDEIDRIASSTHYNGIKLLDGSLGGEMATSLAGGTTTKGLQYEDGSEYAIVNELAKYGFNCEINSANDDIVGEVILKSYSSTFDGSYATLLITSEKETGEASARVALQIGDKTYFGVLADSVTGDIVDEDGTKYSVGTDIHRNTYVFFDEDGIMVSTFLSADNANAMPIRGGESGVISNIKLEDSKTDTLLVKNNSNDPNSITETHALYNAMFANSSSELIFQIGANGGADQRVGLRVENMSTSNLGTKQATAYNTTGTIAGVSVMTREEADDAINIIDLATNQISATRAELGALQNRLEHTLNNLGVTSENLQAAESTIRDVDMAEEMMEFTKNNILVQAAQAMLAQANALPQGILSLLQ